MCDAPDSSNVGYFFIGVYVRGPRLPLFVYPTTDPLPLSFISIAGSTANNAGVNLQVCQCYFPRSIYRP